VRLMKFLLIPMMGLTLVGCAYKDIVQTTDSVLFIDRALAPEGSAKAVADADWSQAEKVTFSLDEYGFTPLFSEIKVGKPYIFVFKNTDDGKRAVVGDDFFDNLAVKSLSGNSKVVPSSSIQSIDLRDVTTRELMAIPLKKGRFEISDGGKGFTAGGWHLNPFKHILGYPAGFITVE